MAYKDFVQGDHIPNDLDVAAGNEISWPGPRLSFSQDFVQAGAQVLNSRKDDAFRASGDFDFGMHIPDLDCESGKSMLAADELFQNGRILPLPLVPRVPRPGRDRHGQTEVFKVSECIDKEFRPISCLPPPPAPADSVILPTPANSVPPDSVTLPIAAKTPRNSSWKEMFGIGKMDHGSSEKFVRSCSKVLFRSSSASKVESSSLPLEPLLGRSASDSGATCCPSSDIPCFAVRPVHDAVSSSCRSVGVDKQSEGSCDHVSEPCDHARNFQTQRSRDAKAKRRDLGLVAPPIAHISCDKKVNKQVCESEQVKVSSNLRNALDGRMSSSKPALPSVKSEKGRCSENSKDPDKIAKHRDAWRAYDRPVMHPNVKITPVLHMEVCMAQSSVVSKVSKVKLFDYHQLPFVKKEKACSDSKPHLAA